MTTITETAKSFFAACETGRGWEGCQAYCAPDATFAAQAEPLADMHTLQQYTEWMKGLLTILTDGRYEVKSFATDAERDNVSAYGVFTGTHLAGGPCPPHGKTTHTDYVYVMDFRDGKIAHMTKIWNAGLALKSSVGREELLRKRSTHRHRTHSAETLAHRDRGRSGDGGPRRLHAGGLLGCDDPILETSPDGAWTLSVCRRPMWFSMPGGASDAPGWIVLRDRSGAIRGVSELDMMQNWGSERPVEWSADRVEKSLTVELPLVPARNGLERWVGTRVWRARAAFGFTTTSDDFH